MELVGLVIALALIEYFYFGLLVGRARARSGVEAPAMTGDEVFERYMRVHQNTMEQLVIFVPSMVLFGLYVSDWMAALLGLVFITGRVVYLRAYVAEPRTRRHGVAITALAQTLLLAGGAIGALVQWF